MKNVRRKLIKALALSVLFTGLTAVAGTSPAAAAAFSVSFTDCVESIGVGLVPTANAQEYVPPEFIVVGTGSPVTPLVVRTARCSIAFHGHGAIVGEIVQIGAVIVPPDGTGDINNYTMFYYTSDLRLALRLILAGVNAQFVPTINYRVENDNSFAVRVPLPGFPRFGLNGTIAPSPNPAGSFSANWWQKTSRGRVKMNTNVAVINIGSANLTLTTNANGRLGQMIGGDTLGFPIIQQFNTFADAQMNVTTLAP